MALNSAVTDTQWSPNFSSGRPAGDPNAIVIHHWGADGQSHQGVVDYLCRADGNSSAHYVASDGRVTQLVHDYDRAWHAGPEGNPRGIGIECRPEMSEGDVETVARLVAAIRSEWGNLPLRGHRDYMSTDCPGRWYQRLAALDALARQVTAGGVATQAAAPTAQAAASAGSGGLVVDGWWGPQTTRALQRALGTTVDGVISSQSAASHRYVPRAGDGWEWVSDPVGSQCVAALQRLVGADADGMVGPATVRALQARLGVAQDGYAGPDTVAALQARLGGGGL